MKRKTITIILPIILYFTFAILKIKDANNTLQIIAFISFIISLIFAIAYFINCIYKFCKKVDKISKEKD